MLCAQCPLITPFNPFLLASYYSLLSTLVARNCLRGLDSIIFISITTYLPVLPPADYGYVPPPSPRPYSNPTVVLFATLYSIVNESIIQVQLKGLTALKADSC